LEQQNDPWHASVRYHVNRSGWLELTKVAGAWETLRNDLSEAFYQPQIPSEECRVLRVRLW
jgi:hypothetical protein